MEKLFEELLDGFKGTEEAKTALLKNIKEAFETAVDDAAEDKVKSLEESVTKRIEEANVAYKEMLKEESERITKEQFEQVLTPRIEKFTIEAASSIHESFKEKIQESARGELADALLKSIAESASQYQLCVNPESKKIFEEKDSKIADLSTRLEKKIDEAKSVTSELNQIKAGQIFESVTVGLTDICKGTIKEAADKVTYVNDEQYKQAITSIKESFAPVAPKTDKQSETKEKTTVTESAETDFEKYLKTINFS